jgi:hypothetical protein
MRRCCTLFVLTCTVLAGCQSSKAPTVPTPLVHQHKWGNYVIEYDDLPGNDYSFQATFEDDDKGNQVEVVNLTINGKTQQLRFRNGSVSVDGVDYGAVQKGDKLKLAVEGRLLVNDTERKP